MNNLEPDIIEVKLFLKKGGTPVQFRSHLLEKGFPSNVASKISKQAFYEFLKKNGKLKIIYGICWFTVCIIISFLLYKFTYTIYGWFLGGAIWGIIQLLTGILNINSANTTWKQYSED